MEDYPRLLSRKQRLVCVGRTGTGKTVAALWHLSTRSLETEPWIIFDFKSDEWINQIPNAREIDYSYVPKKKDTGIFIIHAMPNDATPPDNRTPSKVEDYLWSIWARQYCGVFCDEGYMMQDNGAFRACLTQGRSRRIPMIVCSQRPVWLSRFAFSEADFFQIFHLNDVRDQRTVESFVPVEMVRAEALKEYWSYYYDVGKHKLHTFKPVPRPEDIMQTFADKLPAKRRWF
jgi:hypothetical protein